MKHTVFICFLLCFFSLVNPYRASAQTTGRITGTLADRDNQPVSFANITLLNSENDQVMGGDITRDDGSFSITSGNGIFSLRVSVAGFDDTIIRNIEISAEASVKNLGRLAIERTSTKLKEVKITGERSQVEMNIDKKVFHTDKNITATGGSATDLLQNIPSVSVDAGGNVSLRGKSDVNLLIDGKPATLLGGDVASALQSLPAASIESIEVITNPSAKYDAQGTTGVINIITKKDKKAGLNGSATIGIGSRDKYNGGVNMNVKNNKWNISLNSNFRINNNYNRSSTDRESLISDTSSNIYSDYQRVFTGWFNSLSAEYTIDKNNTLAVTQNLNLMRFSSSGNATFRIMAHPGDLYRLQNRYEEFFGGPNSSSTNINYKHKFRRPKEEITTDITFARTTSEHRQQLLTNDYDNTGVLIYGPVKQDIPSAGSNASLNAQADYTVPFLSAGGRLDAGLKTQNFWFESANAPTITYPSAPTIADSFLSNNYSYTQQTHAAYASINDQYGKWSYQAGLRIEYAGYSGTVRSLSGKIYSNHFLNPFPSLYLSYQLDKNSQLYINYTKRTSRPFFMQLIPYINIANALDTTSGNPDLKPEFINNIELAYNATLPKGSSFMASLYYQRISNLIQNYTQPYADGTSFSQPRNLSYGNTYGFELTNKIQLLRTWDAMINLNFFQNDIQGGQATPGIDNSGFSWLGKINTTLKLPLNSSIQLMANYESSKPAAQGNLQEVYWIDIAIKKTFLDSKATLTLNITDIFNTRKYTTDYHLSVFEQTSYRDRETRIGTLTFSYRFGKNETGNNRRQKQGNSNDKKDSREHDSNLKTNEDDNGGGMQNNNNGNK